MKRKKSKSLIAKSDLEPILEIVTRERDISKWPVDKLIDRTLGLFLDKDEAVNPDIVESVLDSLSKLQKVQKDKESMATFLKIYRKYEDLFEFFLRDSSNLLAQFYRICSFIYFIVILVKEIDPEREEAMSRIDYDDPKDGEEWGRVWDEVEDRIISNICLGIVDDEIRDISRYNTKSNIPLKLEGNLPDSLKKKYLLSPNYYLCRKREQIKKLPDFFAKICLEEEGRVDYGEDFYEIYDLNLSNLNLRVLPEEIGSLFSLKNLHLQFNRLKTLPESLPKLKSLKRLDLRGNPLEFTRKSLETLPDSIRILLKRGVIITFPNEKLFSFKKEIGDPPIGSFFKLNPDLSVKSSPILSEDLPTKKILTLDPDFLCKNDTEALFELTEIPQLRDKVEQVLEEKIPGCYSGSFNITIMDKRIIVFGFGYTDLKKIPEPIFKLDALQKLYLENNRLTEIPDLISRLKNLRMLVLYSNKIRRVSDSINHLDLLESIYLQRNRLKTLPEDISNLRKLDSLNLSRNDLRQLPESIINLERLRYLDISNNPLLIISYQISKFLNRERDGSMGYVSGQKIIRVIE